ncbi:hypothetical protein T01_5078 [Trichinella spiralis]|uniref:Uncharacterized protein n=1 Tax=Trichinella spiralis TaxID=6334 RepID=A0A0V1BA35_TRISP|nr:hypothetical protein T01_5078 [Trichinella spiralis]
MEQIFYTQTKRGRSMLSDMFAENASECTTKMWILLTPVCWVQRIQTTTPQCCKQISNNNQPLKR